MKILLVGPKWIGGWLEGVERGIQMMGYDVQTFAYITPNAPSVIQNKLLLGSYVPSVFLPFLFPAAQSIGSAWEYNMNQELIKVGTEYQADLVLVLKGELLHPNTLEALKISGKRVVSWWVDNPILYFRDYPQVVDQLQMVDAFFMFDYSGFDELKKNGVSNPLYLPCACDPNIYYPKNVRRSDRESYRCDVAFIANYYPERGRLIKQMQGLNVAVWGGGWKNSSELRAFPPGTLRGKKLSGSDVATVYNVASICPNVHHSQSLAGGLNMRTYEIPAAGGFEMTDYIQGLEDQFDIGSEIIVYNSPEHFRELAEYYLSNPDERRVIAKRGRERVLRDHTYEQRMKSMFKVLK